MTTKGHKGGYRPKLVRIPRSEIYKLSRKKINNRRAELVKFYRAKLQEMNKKGIFEDRINLVRVQNMLRYAISKIDVNEIIRQSREELIRNRSEKPVKQVRTLEVDHQKMLSKVFSQQRRKVKIMENLLGQQGGSTSQSFMSPGTPREERRRMNLRQRLPQIKKKIMKMPKPKPPLRRRNTRKKISPSSSSISSLRRSSKKGRGSKRSSISSTSVESKSGQVEEEDLLFPNEEYPDVDYTLSSVLDRFMEYNVDSVSTPSFIRNRTDRKQNYQKQEEEKKRKMRESMAKKMAMGIDQDSILVKGEGDDDDEESGEGDGEVEKVAVVYDEELFDRFRETQASPSKRTKFPSILEKHFRREWKNPQAVVEPDDEGLSPEQRIRIKNEYEVTQRNFRRKLNRYVIDRKSDSTLDGRYGVFKKSSFDYGYEQMQPQKPKEKKFQKLMTNYQRDALEKKKDRLNRRYERSVPQNTEFPRIKAQSFFEFVKEEEEKERKMKAFQLRLERSEKRRKSQKKKKNGEEEQEQKEEGENGKKEGEEKEREGELTKEERKKEENKRIKLDKARQHFQVLQLCMLLEKSITILCREFNEILRTANRENAIEQPEVPVLRELLLMSLKLIPVSKSLRAKRSWVKGAEILFLWELHIDTPFSVSNERHLKLLALKYVSLYFDNDRVLKIIDDMKTECEKEKKIVKGWEQEKTEFLQALINRRTAIKGDPFAVAVRFLKDHRKMEEGVIQEEQQKLRIDGEYGWSMIKNFADSDSTGIGTFIYRIYLNNKKLLYVINCYMNYCGLDTQKYFHILVDKFKTKKIQLGLPEPRVDIREEGKDILQNHSFDDFLNFIIRTNQLVELRKELEEKRRELELKRRLESRKGLNTHIEYIGDMMGSLREMVKDINRQVEEEKKKYSLRKRKKTRSSSSESLDTDELSSYDVEKFSLKNIPNITNTLLGGEVMRKSIMKKKEVDYYGEMHHLIQDEDMYGEVAKVPSVLDISGKDGGFERVIEEQEVIVDKKQNRLDHLKQLLHDERERRKSIEKPNVDDKFKPVDLSTPIPRAYSWAELQSVFDEKDKNKRKENETEEERRARMRRAGLGGTPKRKRFGMVDIGNGDDSKNPVVVEKRKKKNLASMLEELRKAEEEKKKRRELRRQKKLERIAKKIAALDQKLIEGHDVKKEIDELQKKIEGEMLGTDDDKDDEDSDEEEKEGEEDDEEEGEEEWEEYEVEEEVEEIGPDGVVKPFSKKKKRLRRKRKRRPTKEESQIRKLIRQDTARMEEIRSFFEQRKKGGRISQRNKKRLALLIKDCYDRSKTLKRLSELEEEEKRLQEEQKKSKHLLEGVEIFNGLEQHDKAAGKKGSTPHMKSQIREKLRLMHLRKITHGKTVLQKLKDKIDAEKRRLKEMMIDQEKKNKERDNEYMREIEDNRKVRNQLGELKMKFLQTEKKLTKEQSQQFITDVTFRLTQVGENEDLANSAINLLKTVVGQPDRLDCEEGSIKELQTLLRTMEKKRKQRVVKEREFSKQVDGLFSGADFVRDVASELQGRDSEERKLKKFLNTFVDKEEKKRKKRLGIREELESPQTRIRRKKKKKMKKKRRKKKKKRKKKRRRKKKIGEGVEGILEETGEFISEDEEEGEESEEEDVEEDDDDIDVLDFFGSEFMNDYQNNLKKRLKINKKNVRKKKKQKEQKMKKEEERLRRIGKKYSPSRKKRKKHKEEEVEGEDDEGLEDDEDLKAIPGFKLYNENSGIRRGSENWHIVLGEDGKMIKDSLAILEEMKKIWEKLLLSPLEIINFEQRFNDPPYITHLRLISQLYNMWRCAMQLVLKREKVLEEMFEFEKKQMKHQGQKIKKRIENSIEKKRVYYFKLLTSLGMECEKISVQLMEEHDVELKYKGMNYVDKIKNDYKAVLYAIEGRYLRASSFNHYEEVLEKISSIIKDMKRKK